MKTPIGAIATIQFHNEPEPIEGYYFSFGEYAENTDRDSFGVHDHHIFCCDLSFIGIEMLVFSTPAQV